MEELKKEKSAEQLKFETELLTLCDKYEIDAENITKDFFNELYAYIEQKLKEARIEENRRWISKEVPETSNIIFISNKMLSERISQLENK